MAQTSNAIVIKTKYVPDAIKQEQRRRMLKQREAKALRSMNEADAEQLFPRGTARLPAATCREPRGSPERRSNSTRTHSLPDLFGDNSCDGESTCGRSSLLPSGQETIAAGAADSLQLRHGPCRPGTTRQGTPGFGSVFRYYGIIAKGGMA